MRIFSGIQPTGAKHFGNYSGGFRQYVSTADQNEAFFCVVDLHSISVPYDPVDFRNTCLDLAAMLFATGLDPERSTVFIQSHVTAHPEASWLLSGVATVGELKRMTQFKDKSRGQDSVSAVLFGYPVLMAADILLYQTDAVPVVDDQRQHVQLPPRRAPDKPGISNLIEIMAVATGTSPAAVEKEYEGQGYGRFKPGVAEAVIELLAPIKRRYLELRADAGELERLLARGAEKARAVSR